MNEQMTPETEADESHPAFAAAMQMVQEVLYGKKSAMDVAKGLKAGGNPVEALANTAYEIVSIVDERTDGAIPDELLALFAARVLEEVCEIGEAAGIEVTGAVAAEAMREMILRYAGEQGQDTTELQAAMMKVDPKQFEEVA